MSDLILQSNQSSVILRSLSESDSKNLAYDIPQSYPILAKQYKQMQPQNQPTGAVAGQEVAFNLNKSMLLRDLMVRTQYTTAATTIAITQFVGLNMFESIQLRSNNKVILSLSDYYINDRVSQCPVEKQTAIYRRALPLIPTTELPFTTGLTSGVTYTPVFSSFFEDVKNAFDLNFYEQMQLVVKFNQTIRGGFAEALTSANVTLWVWTHQLDDKGYNMLRAENQNPSRPLNMLCYNTFTEYLACTSTTQTKIRLNINYPVFNMYVSLVKNNVIAGVATRARILSFDFAVGGTKLLESVPNLVGNWESSSHGAGAEKLTSATAIARDDLKPIALNWGLEPMNRVGCSGAISFNQINFPEITVNYLAADVSTASDWNVVISYEYWNIITLDSANGQCAISISS